MEITDWQVIQLAKEISLPLGILVEQLIREKNDKIEQLWSTADSRQSAKEKEENS